MSYENGNQVSIMKRGNQHKEILLARIDPRTASIPDASLHSLFLGTFVTRER